MFDEQKNIAYRNDFGLIELVKSGAKSTIAHGYGKTKLSAVKAIKAVIENGNIITYTPNYEKTSVDRYIIAARGKIDNADAIMGVIVKSYPATKKNSKFYLHEVTIIKEADLPSMTAPQLSVDTVNKSASNNNISQISETVKENSNKFSISENDSDGNKLTKQQREYFKDSKVVDENGNLLVVYHQTDSDFTVFDTHHEGAGSYDYETPYGVFLKPMNNNIGVKGSKQMKLYANITNPLIVPNRAEMLRYLKKNAQYAECVSKIDGANRTFKEKSDDAIKAFRDYIITWRRENPKAKSGEIYNDAKFNKLFEAEDTISSEWTNTINNLSEKAKSLINDTLTADGYDGVIINLDAGSFGRSVKSIIALENTQVKNVDNESPTVNEDIRFSLSEPVEEKDNLIAVHNIYTDKLAKSLKLGGFPMSSIAVTKADMGHGNYGECSFVFDKSTIDPKVDKRNKVYGGDAWTPTYPAIEYKASEDVIQRVKDTREHNLFGNDGTFMHCSGGAFLLPKMLNAEGRSRWQSLRSADFLCGISEFTQLPVSVLACVGGFLDGI